MEEQVTQLVRRCLGAVAQLETAERKLDELMLTAVLSERRAWDELDRLKALSERAQCLQQALEAAVYAWNCPN